MYDKQTINHLTSEYLSGQKAVENDLLEALTPMIDIILSKGYLSRKSDWDDLRQCALWDLYKILKRKPKGLRIALTEYDNAAGYFYFRIRAFLNQNFNREGYDNNKNNIVFFEDLPGRYKKRLGLPVDEE